MGKMVPNFVQQLSAVDEERERRLVEPAKVTQELRVSGVSFFDTGDDFSYEFSLRDLYLPLIAEDEPKCARYGLFVGWEFTVDTARAFLEVSSREARVVATTFLDTIHQSGGHSCWQDRLLVAPVRLRADAEASVRDIVTRYWFTNLQRADDEVRQNFFELAQQRGLDTSEALARTSCLKEAIYPLDASETNMKRLAADPERQERLLKPFMADDRLLKRLCLFIISDNSD